MFKPCLFLFFEGIPGGLSYLESIGRVPGDKILKKWSFLLNRGGSCWSFLIFVLFFSLFSFGGDEDAGRGWRGLQDLGEGGADLRWGLSF